MVIIEAKLAEIVPITALKGCKCRIQIDDSNTIMEINTTNAHSNSVRWTNNEGFKQIDLVAGNHTIDVDFCSAFSGKTVRLRRARLELRRV